MALGPVFIHPKVEYSPNEVDICLPGQSCRTLTAKRLGQGPRRKKAPNKCLLASPRMCKFRHFPALMSMSTLYLLSTAGTKPQSLRVWALVDRSQGACGQSSGPGTRLDRCHSSSKLPKTQEPTYPRKQDDDANIKVGWERLRENGNPPEREDVKQQVLYPSQITMKSHLLESPISKCPLYLACYHLKTERSQRDWERQGDAGSEG